MNKEQAQKRAEEIADLIWRDIKNHEMTGNAHPKVVMERVYMAAYSDLAPKIEKLVEALERLSRPYSEDIEELSTIEWVVIVSKEALKQWKEGGV